MDLTCYLHPSWKPRIRPAAAQRDWMDASPESFAYRCLPLSIANSHGWEVLSPCTFMARWNGQMGVEGVEIAIPTDVPPELRPVSIFGQAVLTFHVQGLFRTPPGWNLWVGGSPNQLKDGIGALTGVIETDWAPYTFTMNWRFTRPHHWVKFEENEPVAFFFPVQRNYLNAVQPAYRKLDSDPDTARRFADWSRSRTEFQARVAANPPAAPADKWQKSYYRGVMPDESPGAPDHQTKLRLKPFRE